MKIDLSADIDNLAYLNYMQEQEAAEKDQEDPTREEAANQSGWMAAGEQEKQ